MISPSHSGYPTFKNRRRWEPDRSEKNQRKLARRLLRYQAQTPWGFVKSLSLDAEDFLREALEEKGPEWLDRWVLEDFSIAVRRDVTSWNVYTRYEFDKNGEEVEAEFYKAEFRVTTRWKGRDIDRGWLDLTWDDDFDQPSDTDLDTILEYILKRVEIPEDAGFQEESEL